MKDDDAIPLEPVTDEATEARIVAWVLGEASAFEITELERLCAEKLAMSSSIPRRCAEPTLA